MALVHGKKTYVSVDGNDLSGYTKTSEFGRSADTHDVTVYGNDSKAYHEGLLDATFSMEGFYDSTATTGPRAVLKGLFGGGPVEVIRRPEGTGSSLPEDTFQAILTSYTETDPVDDMVTWSAEFQVSGDVDDTPQAA